MKSGPQKTKNVVQKVFFQYGQVIGYHISCVVDTSFEAIIEEPVINIPIPKLRRLQF